MCRHVAAVVGLCLVFSGAVEVWRSARPARVRPIIDTVAVTDPNDARGQTMDELRKRRDRFDLAMQRVIEDLEQRRSSLAEASDYLFFYCVQFYPEYLEHLWVLEPGAATRVKIAHNLLAYFRADRDAVHTSDRA